MEIPAQPTRTVDEICQAMSRVRHEARNDAADMRQSMNTLFDWRYYVKRHPWACAGAAAAVGAMLVPRAAKPFPLDPKTLASELKAHGINAIRADGDERPSPGFVQGLIGLAMPLAFRAGMSLAASYFQHRSAPAIPAGSVADDDATQAAVSQEAL